MNQKRWIDIGLAGTALLAFLVLRKAAEALWDLGRFQFGSDWYVGVPDLIGLAIAGSLYFYLTHSESIGTFAKDVVLELSKVTSPTFKEVQVSTVIVVVMVSIASIVLLVFNSVWAWVSQKLLSL